MVNRLVITLLLWAVSTCTLGLLSKTLPQVLAGVVILGIGFVQLLRFYVLRPDHD